MIYELSESQMLRMSKDELIRHLQEVHREKYAMQEAMVIFYDAIEKMKEFQQLKDEFDNI